MECTPSDVKSKIENKATEKKFFISQHDESGKTYPKQGIRSSAEVLTEKLNMENNKWSISKEAIFEIMEYKAKSDDESLRGNTWVAKKYNASSKENLKRWKKPVNHNHENACIIAIIVVSDPLSILT